jgi:hypothetical protein
MGKIKLNADGHTEQNSLQDESIRLLEDTIIKL